MTTRALLERYNPVLILFRESPEEFPDRQRPGSKRPGNLGWGDYHPCSADFFLSNVTQSDNVGSWRFGFRSIFRRNFVPLESTGLAAIKQKVIDVGFPTTESWELDVSKIPSQNETQAWQEYAKMLEETPNNPVVYARLAEGPSGRALQYWYLYLYNDFRNNHEGDWEMATIEIDDNDLPVRAAYSAHHGGAVKSWGDVLRHEPGSDRSLLYVARGSHAGYFNYTEGGRHVFNMSFESNSPNGLGWLIAIARKIPGLRRLVDATPADHLIDDGAPSRDIGVRIDPVLKELPDGEIDPASDWWWLNLRCRWGSSHTRMSGTTGPAGPWVPADDEDLRWTDPVGWLASH